MRFFVIVDEVSAVILTRFISEYFDCILLGGLPWSINHNSVGRSSSERFRKTSIVSCIELMRFPPSRASADHCISAMSQLPIWGRNKSILAKMTSDHRYVAADNLESELGTLLMFEPVWHLPSLVQDNNQFDVSSKGLEKFLLHRLDGVAAHCHSKGVDLATSSLLLA